jgi:hypothetical protein
MLCALYHDIKRTTSMLLLCDHSIYLTHALHVSCLLDAPRNFSQDFPQARTVYYILSAPPTTDLYTRSKKYQHRGYINIVKVMQLVEIKHNQ